jgi:3-isopropylmalate/(R)-2-methylmalate dehydratase small subunit
MQPFNLHTGKVLPLDRANVDTDAIIPKQYLKSIRRTGFGPFLFDDWRYFTPGDLGTDQATRKPNPEFVLNKSEHRGATILLARENFGCGSSREHAVWALMDYGFRSVIAPSYSDIFFSNCFKNGMLPVVLAAGEISAVFRAVAENPGASLSIDLEAQKVQWPGGQATFDVDAHRKHMLLNGLDEIGLTLQHADAIRAYEERRGQEAPWLFSNAP